MRLTWFFTVFSARNRCAAISPLVCPPAISDMTSSSRAERRACPLTATASPLSPGTCPWPMTPPVKPTSRPRWRADRGTALFRNCVKTCSYRYRYTKTQLLKPVLTDLRPGQQAGWYGLVGLQRVEERERLRPVPQHGVARGRDVVSVGDRHRAGLRATQRERRLEQVVQVGALVDGDRTRRRRGERQCGERVQVHARACRLGEQRLEKRPLVLNTLQV